MTITRHLCSALCMALAFTWGLGAHSSRAAEDLGPLPVEMRAWDDATRQAQRDAGVKMVASINEAAARGEKEIRIPKGDYRFQTNTGGRYPAHLVFGKEFAGVTLDFQGSTLWFETEASGIVLSKAAKVHLKNVFLDWNPLPFIQGTVVKISPEDNTFNVKLDAGYERTVPGLASENWRGRGIVFDPKTRELKAGQVGCEAGFSWKNRDADGSYRVKFFGFHNVPVAESGIRVGDPYVMLRRMQRAVRVENCPEAVLEDVTLYAAPFIGFVDVAGKGTTYRRCNILRKPGTNRLIAGNADGINCGDMSRGPVIEDCRMDTIGDDFVNIHGYLARVLAQESPTVVVSSRMNLRGAWDKPVTVEFLERKTMRSLGKRQVTATMIPNWKVERGGTLADLTHKWHAGEAAGLEYGKMAVANRLTLDQPIEIKGDVIAVCEAYASPNSVIRGNHFKGSLARGLRLQSPHVVVENNTIETTLGMGISMMGHAAFWGEGPYVYDAVIRNNTLSETGIGGGAGGQRSGLLAEEGDFRTVRLTHDIYVENNRFERCGGPAIVMRGVDNGSIVGNKVDGYDLFPQTAAKNGVQPAGLGSAIVVEACTGMKIAGNEVQNPGPHASGDPVTEIDVTKAP